MAILKYSFLGDKLQKMSNSKCQWNGKTENDMYKGLIKPKWFMYRLITRWKIQFENASF